MTKRRCSINRVEVAVSQIIDANSSLGDLVGPVVEALLNFDGEPSGLGFICRSKRLADLIAVCVSKLGGKTWADPLVAVFVMDAAPDGHLRAIDSFAVDKLHGMNSCTSRSRQKRSGLPRRTAPP